MTIRTQVVFCCLAVVLAGCAKEKPTDTANFAQSFRKSFTESCVAGSTSGANALSAKLATEKCGCMADYLVATYSPDELGALSNSRSTEATTIMDTAIAACK